MGSVFNRSFAFICGVAMTACAAPPGEPSGSGVAPIAAGGRARRATERGAPEAASAVARSAIQDWLRTIPRSRLGAYGFADESELAAATLGEPVALHDIRSELPDPAASDPNAHIDELAVQYLVPVLVNGQPRAFLSTRSLDGRFQVTGFGDANLAAEYGIAAARWPAERGFGLRFARRAGGAAFLLVDAGATTHLVPLASAVRVFHLGTPSVGEVVLADLPPAPAVMAKVRAATGRAVPGLAAR